tara:strand:+ start:7639 stop:8691 length:1053 start_codon:yes stop_codon:yes gene_type:complete
MNTAIETLRDAQIWLADEMADLRPRVRSNNGSAAAICIILGEQGNLFPCEILLPGKDVQIFIESIDAFDDAINNLSRSTGSACHIILSGRQFIMRSLADIRLPRSRAYHMALVDLTRNTPFVPDDVHIVFADRSVSVSDTSYYIIKKSGLDEIVSTLCNSGRSIDAILLQVDGENRSLDKSSLLAIRGMRFAERMNGWLMVACAITLLAGLTGVYGIADHRLQTAQQILNRNISEAQAEAKLAKTKFQRQNLLHEQMSSLRREKNVTSSAVYIWEHLSRVLPDNTWLSDLDFADNKVTLSGFSTSAASLIPLLEKTQQFENPQFKSSVNKVPGQVFERFILQTQIVQAGS